MGLISVIQYTAECDRCGDQLDDLYEDELDVEASAKYFGWVRTGHEFICGDCREFESHEEDSEDEYTGP